MKKHILLLLTIAICMSGCTRKYGCDYGHSGVKETNSSLCRGHGRVQKIIKDEYLIRIDGILIQDNRVPTKIKYVLVRGRFCKEISRYDNKIVYFEGVMNPNDTLNQITVLYDGQVKCVNFVTENGYIVFQKI